MISARARSSFDYLLERAMRRTLASGDEGLCAIESRETLAEICEQESVVLTISSYTFRLIFFFHFTPNKATAQHFLPDGDGTAPSSDGSALHEAIYEFGNICAGALNRDLADHFLQLGMSTPSFLRFGATAFIDTLSAGYLRHFQIVVDSATRFHATLCVCEYGEIDFNVDGREEVKSTGELELF